MSCMQNTYEFTTGTICFDLELNEGKVVDVNLCDLYPVKVLFKSGERESYTFSGLRYIGGNKMLYNQQMKVIPKNKLS